MATEQQIINEIVEKKNDYETRMAWRLSEWLRCAEQVLGRSFTGKENFKPSVQSTELHKARRALTNMTYRMLTSQRPFFQLEPLDIIGYSDPKKLVLAEHYITQQLKLTRFNTALKRAIDWFFTYGTVCAHEVYEPAQNTFLGRRQYATFFRPISLTNVAFALDNYQLCDCGWVCMSDVQPKGYIESLIRNDDPTKPIYKTAALKAATNDTQRPKVNMWIQQRLALAGYQTGAFDAGAMQLSTYYGPLDCVGDGLNYVVQFVNDKHLIRKEKYLGLRPVRIATLNTLDIEPLGNGVYEQFKYHLGQLNDTSNDLVNALRLVGANMFTKQKTLGDEDSEFAIRNFGILELEAPESMRPLTQNPAAIQQLTLAKEMWKQEYRQASGATDTLQALVQGESATATEVSLAMNEAVRNLSVEAETELSEQLVGEHISVVLENWHKYQTKPATVNVKGTPITVTPNDLKMDVDVIVKTMTDQDFRPAKLQRCMTTLQVMSAIPPNAIPGYKTNIGPLLLETLRLLDVPNFAESVSPLTDEDLLRASITNQMLSPQLAPAQQPPVESAAEARMNAQRPGRMEERAVNRAGTQMQDTVQTPVGEVLGAPGDAQQSIKAVRGSNV